MVLSSENACSIHLVRIAWFQVGLFCVGALAWLLSSLRASFVFVMIGIASIIFWHLHLWLVTRLLTPRIRLRLVFGFLIMLKLALLALILRGIIYYFPMEVAPLVTGAMLFSVPILIEAIYLIFQFGPDVTC